MRRFLVFVVLVAVAATAAMAQPDPQDVARDVLRAHARGDVTPLAAAAVRDGIDPWLVAHALLRWGRQDVATAFASAVPGGPDVEALPAYVARSRDVDRDAEVRSTLLKVAAALAAESAEEAMALLVALGPVEDPVFEMEARARRGAALEQLGLAAAAAAAYAEAAVLGEETGWLRGAVEARQAAFAVAMHEPDHHGMREHLTEILRLQRLRGNAAGVGSTLLDLGLVESALGEHPKALAFFARAERALRGLGGGRLSDEHLAHLREAEGHALGELGRYAEALERLGEARRLLGADENPVGACVLSALAGVHVRIGDYEEALPLYQRARQLWEEEDHRHDVATAHGNIGSVHLMRDEPAAALRAYLQALRLFEALEDGHNAALARLGVAQAWVELGYLPESEATSRKLLLAWKGIGDAVAEARTLSILAHALEKRGHPEEALGHLAEAVRTAADVGAFDLESDVNAQKAEVEFTLGRFEDAVRSARAAVGAFGVTTLGLSDEQTTLGRSRRTNVYDVGARSALARGQPDEFIFFLESGRAGALLQALENREAIRVAKIPEPLRKEEDRLRHEEAAALAAYRNAVARNDRVEAVARRGRWDAAREALGRLRSEIQRAARTSADLLYPSPAPLDEIAATLREGEAMVIYAMVGERLAAVVVEPDGTRLQGLGPLSEVVATCEAACVEDLGTDPEEAGRALAGLLLDSLDLDESVHRILVSPDGPLSYVPFSAFCGEREVAYLPSATTYRVLVDQAELRGEMVLALGDPDYGTVASAGPVRRGGEERLSRLPATREEAKTVGDVVLLGREATEANLRRHFARDRRWRAVHLACHGLVDTDRPTRSALAVTPTDEDDGLLTAAEVFTTRISADLVVLSACDTGRGRIVGGEGIVGLMRAFMVAGTPRVLVSLWKVEDEATRALMKRFYEAWREEGQPATTALRSAQEHVRRHPKWSHPRFWAAWSLWGVPDAGPYAAAAGEAGEEKEEKE